MIYFIQGDEEKMNKEKVITFESVEERIKDKKLEELTKADVFDRYIAYGEDKEISDPRIQKLLTKYGYIDELIWVLKSVVIDNEVIKSILASEVVKDENMLVKTGKIKELYFVEDDELPKDFNWLYIKFIDEDNKELIARDIHFKKEPREFELDNYAELNKYKNEILTIIIEKVNNEMRLRCVLKKENENGKS